MEPSDDDKAQDDEVVPTVEPGCDISKVKPSTRSGVRKLHRIWGSIEAIHIHNCWIKADIIPRSWNREAKASQAYGILEMEYESRLIPKVHPSRENRMNSMEFVHDIVGENERGALETDEPSPPSRPEILPTQPNPSSGYVDLFLSQRRSPDAI